MRCPTLEHNHSLGQESSPGPRGRLTPPPGIANPSRRMNRSEFEAALRNLLANAGVAGGNLSCLACEQCQGCSECTFCHSSRGLARCHYCTGCTDCTDCAHCVRSSGCLGCQHCVEAERCIGSAYLVRSVGCNGCNYCFGCVGLSRRDFHVLNQPYDRASYFELTARLERELRIAPP